ncbi:hypothetical protein DMC61_21490 [Amycolatopsis sp. WAC 04169]|nr:hypothetical protein DMC61_21490 [Amycolatopsis sp. WAC 04169]
MQYLLVFDDGFFKACEQRGFVQVEGEGPRCPEGCCLAGQSRAHCRIESGTVRMPVPGESFADIRLDLQLPWDFDGGVGRDGLAAAVEHFDEWKVVGEAYGVASDLVAVVGETV